jgi:hypothetical protein
VTTSDPSGHQPPQSQPGRLPPPPPRSGCATAFMILVGAILLLPGLCALIFGGIALTDPKYISSSDVSFVMVGLLAGFIGILLIWTAIRGRRT